MAFNIHFAGEGTLVDLMNKLIDDLGLSYFASFEGKNLAPMFSDIISELPLLKSSTYKPEASPFILEMPGEICAWTPLFKDEYTGGFIFCVIPKDANTSFDPGDAFRYFAVDLFDALKKHCDEVAVVSRGKVEELDMAMRAAQLVPVPADTMLSVF